MLDSLLHSLRTTHGPTVYALIALTAALEYLVPFFPGNTITLVAVSLAISAGLVAPLVYAMLVLGSVLGFLVAYGAGRLLPLELERGPQFLRRPRLIRGLAAVRVRFEKRGWLFLLGHRFIPVLRGLVFVGAGASREPLRDVLLFGALGAAIFNGGLFALGFLAGDHWDTVVTGIEHYSLFVGAAVVLGVILWLLVRARRARE